MASYVLEGYGTGAVMGVAAHDARDWSFAQEHQLPIRKVIQPTVEEEGGEPGVFTGEGKMISSGDLDGLSSQEARLKIIHILEERQLGEASVKVGHKEKAYYPCVSPQSLSPLSLPIIFYIVSTQGLACL